LWDWDLFGILGANGVGGLFGAEFVSGYFGGMGVPVVDLVVGVLMVIILVDVGEEFVK